MKKKIVCLLFIFTLLFIVQEQVNRSSSKEDTYTDNVRIVGHRGFSSVKVQNSLESMKLADESKYVDEIELDVRLTSDNVLVLSHDDIFLTRYKYKNDVSTMTSIEFLKHNFIDRNRKYFKLKFNNNNKIEDFNLKDKYVGTTTTLETVLNEITDKDIIIDIKYNNNIKLLNYYLLTLVKGHNNVILQSDNIDGLEDLISKNNTYRYQMIVDDWSDYKRLNSNFYSVAANYYNIDYATCKYLIDEGYEVYVWTINDLDTYKQLRSDFKEYAELVHYITDFPNILATYKDRP